MISSDSLLEFGFPVTESNRTAEIIDGKKQLAFAAATTGELTLVDWHSLAGIAQPFSSLSHYLGAVLFLTLSFFLLRNAQRTGGFWSYVIFACSAVLLLTVSGTAHLFSPGSPARKILFRLDLVAIFLLIAGTFTPIHWVLFHGWRRWSVLILIWSMAATGILARLFFMDSIPYAVGTGIFVAMGWVGLFSGVLVRLQYGPGYLGPLLAGGICYTAGAVMDACQWPTPLPMIIGPHELFHLMVLAGLAFQWYFIAQIAAGRIPSRGDALGERHPQPND
ncbi:MAG: hemolysin III family protein [Planctomycetota bacterium]|nr:hemolysin III family protein [Planctomycetota bacterium]